jgi:hypothetical protein
MINILDVQIAVGMVLGYIPCTANIEGPHICSVITAQRVTNAAMGFPCIAYVSHSVTLSWVASTSTGVVGYNIYRRAASAEPYTKINPAPTSATTYTDSNVQAGQTYSYVTTSVDMSGNESAYSNDITAVIPSD